MTPISFAGHTNVLAKDQPQYQPLPVHVGLAPEYRLTSCWELSVEELEQIIRTRKIWIQVLTFGAPMQPILPSAEPPAEIES
jgi:hypothetical protein